MLNSELPVHCVSSSHAAASHEREISCRVSRCSRTLLVLRATNRHVCRTRCSSLAARQPRRRLAPFLSQFAHADSAYDRIWSYAHSFFSPGTATTKDWAQG